MKFPVLTFTAPTLKRMVAGIEPVEIHQALKRGLQRRDVIEAELVGVLRRPEQGESRRGLKKCGAPNIRMPSARV